MKGYTACLVVAICFGAAFAQLDANCEMSVTQTRRSGPGSTWNVDTTGFQIYDLVFTNTGNETLTFAQFDQSFPFPDFEPVSYWGMVKTCCTQIDSAASYNVTIPESGLGVGASLNGGFIIPFNMTAGAVIDPEFQNPVVQTQFFNFVECSA